MIAVWVIVIIISLVGGFFSFTYFLGQGTGFSTGLPIIDKVMYAITFHSKSLTPTLIILGICILVFIIAILYLRKETRG